METNRTLLNRRAGGGGRVRRRLVAVASAACAVLALAGCVEAGPVETTPPDAITAPPDTSTPTETATPTPTPPSAAYFASPPQSEAQAVQDAAAAYQQFLDFRGRTYELEVPVEVIDDIAAGPLRDDVVSSVAAIVESGAAVEINDVFEPDLSSSFAVSTDYPSGDQNEFGSVTIIGCLDLNGRTGTNGDGTPIEMSGNARVIAQIAALYDVDESRWYVHSENALGGGKSIPC